MKKSLRWFRVDRVVVDFSSKSSMEATTRRLTCLLHVKETHDCFNAVDRQEFPDSKLVTASTSRARSIGRAGSGSFSCLS